MIIFSSHVFAQNTKEILKHYQNRGLTFVRIESGVDQKVGGMLVKEVYGRLKIPVEIRPMPGKRALREAMSGRVDGEVMRTMKVQEMAPTLIRLSPHIRELQGSVFTKNKDIEVNGWSSISNYKIGIIRGVQFVADGTKGMKHVQITNTLESVMKMLDKGRVDLVIVDSFNGILELRKLNLDEEIRHLSPPLVTLRLYNYLHVSHRKLAPIVENLLREMFTSGELQKLRNQFEQLIITNVTSVKSGDSIPIFSYPI